MPRDIPVGNGSLLVAFDGDYRIADIYFPHVGMDNHVGSRFRFGVWADGKCRWIEDPGWLKRLRYLKDTLVTDVVCENLELGLRLRCYDVVDYEANVYLRKVVVRDLSGRAREIKLIFHHDFNLSGNAIGDTALFDPQTKSIIHYKGKRYFLVNTGTDRDFGVTEYACGRSAGTAAEGTWRDAEDGVLGMNPISQGSVDSTIAVSLVMEPGGVETAYHWIAAGDKYGDVLNWNEVVTSSGPGLMIGRTASFWYAWANQTVDELRDLPEPVVELYKRSLLVVRTQCDHEGAIIAANDSDIQLVHHDHYSYMWPRDGALVADAMGRAGYHEITRSFLTFAHRIIKKEGYFLHKYNPDGSVASSWHSWVREGELQLPIQEDETALVVWALARYYDRTRNLEFIRSVYRRLVVQPAEFMIDFRDPDTGLPLPSFDLWEERQGVFTFTCAAVYGGLAAAATLAGLFNEQQRRHRYIRALSELREAMSRHLWMPDKKRFARGLVLTGKGMELDDSVDASLYGCFYFGAFDPGDPMVEATMAAVRDRLTVPSATGGLARYEGDSYHRPPDTPSTVPGNPWFVCTLWMAEYLIATARTEADLSPVLELLMWSRDRARPSLVLPEQLHPVTAEPLSVSPLTWSHAQLISAVQAYVGKRRDLMRKS